MEKKSFSAENPSCLLELYVELERNDKIIAEKLKQNKSSKAKSKENEQRDPLRHSPYSSPYSADDINRDWSEEEDDSRTAISLRKPGFTPRNIKIESELSSVISISSSSSDSCTLYEPLYETIELSPSSSQSCSIKKEPGIPDWDNSNAISAESPSNDSNSVYSIPDSDYTPCSGHISSSSGKTATSSLRGSKDPLTFSKVLHAINQTSSKQNGDSRPIGRTSPNVINIKDEPIESDPGDLSDNNRSEHLHSNSKSSNSRGSSQEDPNVFERAAFVRSEVLGNPVLQTLFKDLIVLKTQYDCISIDEQSITRQVKAMKRKNKLPT